MRIEDKGYETCLFYNFLVSKSYLISSKMFLAEKSHQNIVVRSISASGSSGDYHHAILSRLEHLFDIH